ncbi:hypothetical protein EAE96_005014 [Botrytis aclada]|nr:hypothetical protein EAE96_005014 [Botrytis aclada]
MVSPQNPDQVNSGQLISKSTKSADIETFGIEFIAEQQDGVANSGRCVDNIIETKTHRVSMNDLPHDILMNIFDELTPCMIACLGLTCRRFYTSCKIYHPKPFSLALYVDQKCTEGLSIGFCNPLGCSDFSGKETSAPMYKTTRGWYQHETLQTIRKEWYPGHGKHLADLMENWQGLRHYRKTWLDVGRHSYTFYLPRYLSISAYNPSNENCKAKLDLQDRYRDHLLHLPLYGDSRILLYTRIYRPWRGVSRPALPDPRQMDPEVWLLKAREIISKDRYNHARKGKWVSHWRDYAVGKDCRDWPDQEPCDLFSDWREMIEFRNTERVVLGKVNDHAKRLPNLKYLPNST